MYAYVCPLPLSSFPIQRPAQSFLPTAFEEHISIRKECDNLQKNVTLPCSPVVLRISKSVAYYKEIAKCEKLSYWRLFLLFPFEVARESSDLLLCSSTFTMPCAPTKLKDDRVVKGLGTCTKGKYIRKRRYNHSTQWAIWSILTPLTHHKTEEQGHKAFIVTRAATVINLEFKYFIFWASTNDGNSKCNLTLRSILRSPAHFHFQFEKKAVVV